jgi:hypothetical protein
LELGVEGIAARTCEEGMVVAEGDEEIVVAHFSDGRLGMEAVLSCERYF